MKRALFVLIACWAATVAAAPPTCPDVGTVDVQVINGHDPHWYDVPVTAVTLTWEWSYYSDPEHYVIEVWSWAADVQRWRVWQIEPLGKGIALLEQPELAWSSMLLRFYARDISGLCTPVEWALGEVVVNDDPPPVPPANSAWVWDAAAHAFVLKPVMLRRAP